MPYSWKRNLFILWTGSFLVSMAYSVSMPFLSIFLEKDLGVNEHLETWSGLVFAASFLTSALISPFWGSVADKYGRKLMMIRAGFCLSAAYFIYLLVQNPYELLAVRLMEGLLAGYIPSAIALVATGTPEEHTGYALGVLATANAAASVVGPLVGGVVSHWIGPRDTFFVSGAMVFIALLIALLWVREPNFQRSSAPRSRVLDDLKETAANRPLVLIMSMVFLVSTSVMLLEPLLTIYVVQLGSSNASASLNAGIIFSASGIAVLLASPRWGKVGAKIGYGKVLFIGLLGGGIGNLLQVAVPHLVGFGVLRFGYGLFFAAVYPALNAMIVRHTDPSFRGRAFSINQMGNTFGLMLGPILGGFLAGLLSIKLVFAINGVLLLVIALLLKTSKLPLYASGKPAVQRETGM